MRVEKSVDEKGQVIEEVVTADGSVLPLITLKGFFSDDSEHQL